MIRKSKPRLLPVVPQSAVLQDREGSYVLTVDTQNRVITRRIKTGPMIGPEWAVESGLRKGDTIIVQGLLKVRPGMVVKTVPQNPVKGR
jgi:membrane fusion protein (multidrug efflux system)